MNAENAEAILLSCASELMLVKNAFEVRVSLGLLVCELFLTTHELHYYQLALLYLKLEHHIKAVFFFRCIATFEELRFEDTSLRSYNRWLPEQINSSHPLMLESDELDDETAEIVNGLAIVQWLIFFRQAKEENKEIVRKWNSYKKIFPANSFFLERLTAQKEFIILNENDEIEVEWD